MIGNARSTPWTTLRGGLLLLLLGLSAALLLGEILVRLLGAAPQVAFLRNDQFQLSHNVLIGWEPIPNPDSAGSTLDPRWNDAQRNSLGYRDYEHSLAKVPGTYRIEVIGDSIAKGFGTEQHEGTYPSVLERKLKEAGVASEVMNFGVEGYNTQQEVETLRDRGMRYSPDLVVLAYVLNDRSWPAHHLYVEMLKREAAGHEVSRTRLSPLLGQSALYRFLRFVVVDRFFPGAVNSDERVGKLVEMVQKDTVEEYFRVLADLSESGRFDVLVVVFPYLDSLTNYTHRAEHDWVAGLSARHRFHHLDLLDTFVECQRLSKEPVGLDEVHPTYIGLYCAGVRTAQYIQESGLARR